MAASLKKVVINKKFTYSVISTLQRNICSSNAFQNVKQTPQEDSSTSESSDQCQEKFIDSDWIGPPDKTSNIRKIKFNIPPDETSLQMELRERREETQEWHHQFWTKHNQSFGKLKEEFTRTKKTERIKEGVPEDEVTISAEEMSEFYKKFLDENFTLHKNYNREWYKRNAHLLWLALQVNVEKVFSRRKWRKSKITK